MREETEEIPGTGDMYKSLSSASTWYDSGGEIKPLLEHRRQMDLGEDFQRDDAK